MNHYQAYFMERQELSTIENESGFIAFKFRGKECYIGEIFISRDARQKGNGRELLQNVVERAKKAGCNCMTANVYVADPNATSTLMAAFKCGFKLKATSQGVTMIAKELGE